MYSDLVESESGGQSLLQLLLLKAGDCDDTQSQQQDDFKGNTGSVAEVVCSTLKTKYTLEYCSANAP